MTVTLSALESLLDETLEIGRFRDASNNGLQIANNGSVTRVVAGVDASLRLLEAAAARGADAVVCHHGVSWGDSLKRITGLNHRLVSFALAHNLAVYAAHLPLDAHPRYGNNARLCKALGLRRPVPAFTYHGETIGFVAAYERAMPLERFFKRVQKVVAPACRLLPFGKRSIRTVGVVSGGAADMIDQAAAHGVDAYLTGESSLQGYNLAEQLGQTVLFAGHYATETFGVRALAELIRRRLGIPAEFIDFQIEY